MTAAQKELKSALGFRSAAIQSDADAWTGAGDPIPDAADRRCSQRFSLRLAVKCRRIELPVTLDRAIVGESVNISSKGLLFATTEALLPGQVVEARIEWPARLDDHVRLSLIVEGPVVRKVGNHTAMRIERYKFRTRSAAHGQ